MLIIINQVCNGINKTTSIKENKETFFKHYKKTQTFKCQN